MYYTIYVYILCITIKPRHSYSICRYNWWKHRIRYSTKDDNNNIFTFESNIWQIMTILAHKARSKMKDLFCLRYMFYHMTLLVFSVIYPSTIFFIVHTCTIRNVKWRNIAKLSRRRLVKATSFTAKMTFY